MGQKVLFIELIKEEEAILHAEDLPVNLKTVLTKKFPNNFKYEWE